MSVGQRCQEVDPVGMPQIKLGSSLRHPPARLLEVQSQGSGQSVNPPSFHLTTPVRGIPSPAAIPQPPVKGLQRAKECQEDGRSSTPPATVDPNLLVQGSWQ
jgi:hypothetical protein